MKKILPSTVISLILLGCSPSPNEKKIEIDNSSNQNTNISSAVASTGNWIRDEIEEDPFKDLKTLHYTLDSTDKGGSYIVIACTGKKKIVFNWRASGSEKGGAPLGMNDHKILVRIDSDEATNQDWYWSSTSPTFWPATEISDKFIASLIGKKKLALRWEEMGYEVTKVFDITGFDAAYEDVKNYCTK